MVSLINFRSFNEATSAGGEHHQVEMSQTGASPPPLNSERLPSFMLNDSHESSKYFVNQQQAHNANNISSNLKNHGKQMAANVNSNGQLGIVMNSNPKEHFEIRWSNLNYQVEPKWYQQNWRSMLGGGGGDGSQKAGSPRTANILNSLNGSVKSGEVTAILGPSGAGKTSLLGCLTGKNKSGVSGSVQVISTNGGPGRLEPLSICTIPQKDYLLNQLTVRENLWFASRLKHPVEGFDHETNIERVVELLKLEVCIDTKISKISGGQYKRVSIAQELLSNPDILILDEPTSGLDSLTCYKTVMVLRDLARLSPNPMAIIVTIHQPQREVFDLFNHIYILAVGGRCIYEGQPAQSIKTINECSGGLHFDSDQYNPASYLVEIASSEFGEKPIEALVEHQRNQFKRMTSAQDRRNDLLTRKQLAGNGGQGHLSGSINDLKRRAQSPMIARFKSMLTGSASSPQISSLVSQSQSQPPPSPTPNRLRRIDQNGGYSNEAYESTQALNELHKKRNNTQTVYLNNNNNNNNNSTSDGHQQRTSNVNHNNKEPSSHQHNTTTTTDINNHQASLKKQPETISSTLKNNDDGEDLEEDYEDYSATQSASSGVTQPDEGEFFLDTRLQTHKHNHKGHFLRHCQLLTKRSWLCLCKDPMLTTLRFSAHIVVPLLITIVYGSKVGKPNACPLYETDMDLIDYARRGAKRLLNLQDELRCTFENVGLYFLSIYAFTFSTMCLTSLSFPLNMHVLLKEVRNGWYSIPTYFIGKTLADFPLEFILPTLTLMITYPLTGQPSSYLEWRFILATGIFVITSLIAQTQGLIFGALFMNAMQAAVFVAPVSTTPLILLSGFLIRISQMPIYLQKLSCFSYFRYAIESLTIIRYGFGQCECDPTVVTGKPVSASGVPDQLRTMTNYWLSTFDVAGEGANSLEGSDYSTLNETIASVATTTLDGLLPTAASNLSDSMASALAITTTTTEASVAATTQVDFFQDLTVLLARANSFGADIKTCKDLKPYPMIDFSLEDDQLYIWVAALVATLFLSKVANYYVVKYSVKWRL